MANEGRENLPALVTRAGQRLLDARSSAEVLEAKALAEAALHYAKITKAANDTHADCLRIITRAEMRMADEIDKTPSAQGRNLPNVQTPDERASYDEMGLDRRRVAEWREVRDAGEGVVESALQNALAEGRAPTKAEILNAAKAIRAEQQSEKADKRAEREATLANATRRASEAMGLQKYNVILADPPWRFEPYSRETGMDRAADNHYPTESVETIAALDVPDAAADDAVLFLWATAPMLPEALDVMSAWGFQYKSHLIWEKDRLGTGYWARNKHELLLIGTRGNIPAPSPGTQPESVVKAPVGRHSEKPAIFYEIIERLFPNVPKLEMFAREHRAGWDSWGNEVGEAA